MCVCVWECFVLNCFLPCYSASFKQEHVHLSSIIPCRDSSLIGSEFEKVLAQLLCNIFLIEWCVSLTSKIFKARLKCFVLLSTFSLLCPTNKPPDSRHSQLHFHINTFPWPGMRAHAVSAVSGSICPAPSPICCLPACQSEAALWRSHAAGLPLNIIIVHYYGVSFLIHYYVRSSNTILNAFATAARFHPNISFSVTKTHDQLPSLGHGSRSSPRCRNFLRQITKWLQPAVDTHTNHLPSTKHFSGKPKTLNVK